MSIDIDEQAGLIIEFEKRYFSAPDDSGRLRVMNTARAALADPAYDVLNGAGRVKITTKAKARARLIEVMLRVK